MKGIDVCEVEERVTELGGRMTELAGDMRQRADNAQQELKRNLRKVRAKADDMLEEGRHEIKSHPLTAVAGFAAVGLVLGFVAGMLFSNRKRF